MPEASRIQLSNKLVTLRDQSLPPVYDRLPALHIPVRLEERLLIIAFTPTTFVREAVDWKSLPPDFGSNCARTFRASSVSKNSDASRSQTSESCLGFVAVSPSLADEPGHLTSARGETYFPRIGLLARQRAESMVRYLLLLSRHSVLSSPPYPAWLARKSSVRRVFCTFGPS
jgi:hypothetical protein